jgi:hypothetical protein
MCDATSNDGISSIKLVTEKLLKTYWLSDRMTCQYHQLLSQDDGDCHRETDVDLVVSGQNVSSIPNADMLILSGTDFWTQYVCH